VTGITATSCELGRLYWLSDGAIMYGDPNEPFGGARTLYSYLDSDWYIGNFLGIAINEDMGKLFIGGSNGLFMAELDGSSNRAVVLDRPNNTRSENYSYNAPAVVLDPSNGYLYYGGRSFDKNNEGYVKVLRPPYTTEKPRLLYTPQFFNYYDYNGQPRDITIHPPSNSLFFVENNVVYKAKLDGTSPNPQILFRRDQFNYENVRTIDYYMDLLFIGVFPEYGGDSSIYEANPDGSGNPVKIYSIPLNTTYRDSGIRGLAVVPDCPSPTASPTPCDPDKEGTFQVYPLSTSMIPMGLTTITFVITLAWESNRVSSMTIDIQKQASSGEWEDHTTGLAVDLATGVYGTYVVVVEDVGDSGTFRWMATTALVNDPCQTQDMTGWEEFSI
jgi:hypothetical protein